jgi:Holliday junction resolvase
MIMAINSKQKGKRFELTLAKKLREYGYETRRTAQYCGNTGDASDVVGLPYLHIEAKHVERLNIYDAMAQAKSDARAGGKGLIPIVFHKKNNCEILVTMELDDFMKIYTEFEAGKELKNED